LIHIYLIGYHRQRGKHSSCSIWISWSRKRRKQNGDLLLNEQAPVTIHGIPEKAHR